jgi:hypothetical protein
MKRSALLSLFLVLMTLPTALPAKEKAKPVDMKNIKTVFIGWVDIDPADYHKQGYSTKEEYAKVIKGANFTFQNHCKGLQGFAGRTVTGATDRGDAGASGSDLYVKFSDVKYDHGYQLHIAVHFLDPKTNNELGSIPLKAHGAHFCTLTTCLDKELDEVSGEIEKQVASGVSQ